MTTELKPYPEYTASGVEWLGELPKGWKAQPIKHLATYNDEVLTDSVPPDAEITYIEISDVDQYSGVRLREPIRFGDAPSRARRIVREGDVLVSTVRTYLKAIAAVDEPPPSLIASTGFAVLRASSVHRGFLRYAVLTRSVIDQIIGRSVGVSYPAINASDLVRIQLPTPSFDEQRAIASFLDHETAEINAFIADQQELIALLNERRAATITQAVTKGLNPTVPTKDSGVEWLGKVPEHWSVRSAKNAGAIALGKMLTSSASGEVDVEAPYLRAANVQPAGRLNLEDRKTMWFTPKEVERLTLDAGDVVIVEGGVGGYGRAAYISNGLTGWGFQNSIVRIRPFSGIDGRFLTYAFLHLRHCGYIEMTSSVASMPHFTAEKVQSTVIAWPNGVEQAEIADYLDRETAEIDAAIADAKEAIELSKERRAALISAAVTGKIDVRDHPAAKGAA